MVQVDFINVGYGDAVLLRFFSAGHAVYRVLIDCGDIETGCPSHLSRRIHAADYLKKMGIDALDLVIISHLHLDHVGGLPRIAESVRIKELWTNYLAPREIWGQQASTQGIRNQGDVCLIKALNALNYSVALLDENGCTIRCITDNCSLSVRDESGSMLELFVPDREILDRQRMIFDHVCGNVRNEFELHALDLFINNTSLRAVVTAEDKRISLPGDTYGAYWEHCGYEPCDILKIPHHGHADGITGKILAEMRPSDVVISVSDDRTDDCPSLMLLELLEQMNIPTAFTDAVITGHGSSDHHEAVRYTISRSGIERSYVKI